MGWMELLLIGAGLSMDAFAAAVCEGMGAKKAGAARVTTVALFFGGFQALMPLIGWMLGRRFEGYIARFDHYIAFALLAFIGGKMIFDSFASEEQAPARFGRLDLKELCVLAVATSIDALAVGVTFAFLGVGIRRAAAVIGATAFALSALGVWLGSRFGAQCGQKAEVAGGAILILIGLKILLEHLIT